MKITVTVKPGAMEDAIVKTIEGYRISTTARPERGEANDAVRRIVAGHFGVAQSRVSILRGGTARKKLIEII